MAGRLAHNLKQTIKTLIKQSKTPTNDANIQKQSIKCKQNTLQICIQCHFKSWFIVQQQFKQNLLNQIHSPHQTDAHDTIRYSAPRTEKPQLKPPKLPLEISHTNLAEMFILKMR